MTASSTSHSVFGFALIACTAGAALAGSREARANGRLPAAHELVISPTNPNTFAIEATFGLFISQDTGASFGWVCEPAIGYPATLNWDPSIGITATSILGGLPNGISVSADQGCSWKTTMDGQIVDVVVRQDDPHSALVLASTYTGITDAGSNSFSTQVFATHDDGATWAPQGVAIESDVEVETIDVAPSDPDVIYIGGARTTPESDGSIERTGVVLASTNGGTSYTATAIPLQDSEFAFSAFVSAVDPNDAQRVYVRVSLSTTSVANSNVDRLVVSEDGGSSFQTVYQAKGALLGFALSGDGTKVFLGDSVAGVFSASAPPVDSGATFVFSQRSSASVACLTWSAGDLYACANQPQNPLLREIAVSTDDGATFATLFRFGCVSGALACSSGTLEDTCGPEFGSVQSQVGACDIAFADAGEPDSSVFERDAGGQSVRPSSRGCGCVIGAGAPAGGGGILGLLVAVLVGLRSRRTDRMALSRR